MIGIFIFGVMIAIIGLIAYHNTNKKDWESSYNDELASWQEWDEWHEALKNEP